MEPNPYYNYPNPYYFNYQQQEEQEEKKYIYTPPKPVRIKRGWDKKIPFEQLARRLVDEFNLTISQWYRSKKKKNVSKKLIYLSILLIQLYNGVRIGEAVWAFKEWIVRGVNEPIVGIGKRKDGFAKEFLIPDLLSFNRPTIERAITFAFNNNLDLITPKKLESWSLKTLEINTHTFRKAWENFLSRNWHKDPSYITHWQGRKRLDSHLDYLRTEEFKGELKKLLDPYFR